jgi:hypothetical protein
LFLLVDIFILDKPSKINHMDSVSNIVNKVRKYMKDVFWMEVIMVSESCILTAKNILKDFFTKDCFMDKALFLTTVTPLYTVFLNMVFIDKTLIC